MPIIGYDPNAENEYQRFVNDVNNALLAIRSTDSVNLIGDLNSHIGTDNETWKGVIARHGDPAFYENGLI